MADALHVAGVVSAQEARVDDGGLIAVQGPTALDARTGVMIGPGSTALVTGTAATAPMTVQVAPHHWVTSRGTANGPYRGANEITRSVNIAAAPGSGSRIDVVYVKMQDNTAGVPTPDGAVGELYGVVTGTVGAGKPALPLGAEELATVTVAAGATSTNGAGVTIANTARQTQARGARYNVADPAERTALATAGAVYPGLEVYERSTRRVFRRDTTNNRWDFVDGPWYSWTPTFTSATGGNLGFGTGAQVVGKYVIVDGRIRYDVAITCGTTTNGGVGTIEMLLPTGTVNAGAPARSSGVMDVFVPSIAGIFVGRTIATAGGSVVELWMPKAFNDGTLARFRNATGPGAAGTGVPLVAGSYPIQDGSQLRISGEHDLTSWAAL